MLISLRCPQCDGELSVEEGKEAYFCPYCGTKVVQKPEPKADASSTNDPDVLFGRWVNTLINGGDIGMATKVFRQKCFDDSRIKIINMAEQRNYYRKSMLSREYKKDIDALSLIIKKRNTTSEGEQRFLKFLRDAQIVQEQKEQEWRDDREEWEKVLEAELAEYREEERKQEAAIQKNREEIAIAEENARKAAQERNKNNLIVKLLIFSVAIAAMVGCLIYFFCCGRAWQRVVFSPVFFTIIIFLIYVIISDIMDYMRHKY